MRHGSLFSGIGGFDLAAEWMGWTNIFHCEWMEFPRKVLDYHFPDADSHIDICKTDFKKYANKIDILTGGFPCQPFSLAGKRKGQDDERYLWGEMLRAIQEIKPRFVIAENVFGITNIDGGLVFQQVCVDLENEGYEVQPFIIPACAKNAPHRRDRCWFIAYNNKRNREEIGFQTRGEKHLDRIEGKKYATNSNGSGTQARKVGTILGESHSKRQTRGLINDAVQKYATNTESIGRKKALEIGELERGRFRFGNKPPTWDSFPSQSPVCGGDDGISTELDGITFSKWRAESIKAYGNAIVPQIAYQLFQIINEL
jgi:DNA (cytosine-5)-methyltransferase 1